MRRSRRKQPDLGSNRLWYTMITTWLYRDYVHGKRIEGLNSWILCIARLQFSARASENCRVVENSLFCSVIAVIYGVSYRLNHSN